MTLVYDDRGHLIYTQVIYIVTLAQNTTHIY